MGAAAPPGELVDGGAGGALLGVIHKHRALGNTVGHNGPRRHHTIAVICFDPFVVLDPDLFGILVGHPDHLAAAGNGKHMQVVVVL